MPWLAPFRPNGKPLHVHGFLGAFERIAERQRRNAAGPGGRERALVGLDPVDDVDLPVRVPVPWVRTGAQVLLVQEWLARQLDALPASDGGAEYLLLPHCTERATAPVAVREWQTVFAARPRVEDPTIRLLRHGGHYGHEAEHRATSEHIYALSWARHVAQAGADRTSARRRVLMPVTGETR